MPVQKRGTKWYAQYQVNGKRYNYPLPEAKTEGQAKRMLNDDRNALRSGEAPLWMEQKATEDTILEPHHVGHTLRKASNRQYKEYWQYQSDGDNALRKMERIIDLMGDVDLGEIDNEWLSTLRGKLADELPTHTTVNRYLAAIRTVLKKSVTEFHFLKIMPLVVDFKVVKHKRTKVVTLKEAHEVAAKFNSTNRYEYADLVWFLWHTGCRLGEALHLEWDEVDLDRGEVMLTPDKTKGCKYRYIELDPELTAILKNQKMRGLAKPFANLTKCRNPASQCGTALRRVLTDIGNDGWCWHAFRHTMATRLAENDATSIEIMAFMGWSDLAMVNNYVHFAKAKGVASKYLRNAS